MMEVRRQWRCFSAASLPFFFLETIDRSGANLAEGENHNKKMPPMRRIHFRRTFRRHSKTEGKVSSVRKCEKLEGWKNKSRYTAVFVQRLQHSIYRALTTKLSLFQGGF
jgi:hypothetical protein